MSPDASTLDLADLVRRLSLTLIPMVLSLSVHECAHALTAYWLGDSTAKDAGRMSLNPQSHIDPVGTLLIPILSVVAGGIGFIGWARPTPFRPDKMRKGVSRRLGSALVSVAGPLSNLLLAVLALGLTTLLSRTRFPLVRWMQDEDTWSINHTPVGLLLTSFFTLNVALAVFNLLPIPPLDGSKLLPPPLDRLVRPLERHGFAILFVIFMLLPGVARVIFHVPAAYVRAFLERMMGTA